MPYGTIKIDTVTFTDAGVDKSVTLSGLVQNPTFSGNVTVTGTLSGVTVTGTTANFTSGNFTNISGGTHTITSGVFAAGSEASPSITFTGDLNTGLYSPGADQVAISTGGSGRLFVDASGNVNIDSNTFYVDAVNNRVAIGISNPLQLLHLSSSNPPITQITYQGVGAAQTGVVAGGAYTIGVDGGNGSTERLRITSAGLVGIGTSSPQGLFHLQQSLSDSTPILALGEGSNTVRYSIIQESGYTGFSHGNQNINLKFKTYASGGSGGTISFWTGVNSASERVTIDFSGNVGIGTTNPSQLLTLQQTSAGAAVDCLFLNNSSVNANTSVGISFGPNVSNTVDRSAVIRGINESNGSGNATGLQFLTNANGASPTEKARIDSSGRLLVGTSSSSAGTRATFQGNSGSASGEGVVRINRGAATPANGDTLGVIVFGDSADSEGAYVFGARDGGTWSGSSKPSRLVFSTTADGASTPTERMRIQNNGNVKIGETTLTARQFSVRDVNSNTVVIGADSNQSSGTGWYLFYGISGNSQLEAWIRGDGTYGSRTNVYGSTSDIKVKENITNASSQWNDIKSIEIKNFNLIGDSTRQLGVIAQQVEQVSPGLVDETPDRDEEGNDIGTVTKSVKYSVLYMKAVKALQEAMERIETLEAKVAALESA